MMVAMGARWAGICYNLMNILAQSAVPRGMVLVCVARARVFDDDGLVGGFLVL